MDEGWLTLKDPPNPPPKTTLLPILSIMTSLAIGGSISAAGVVEVVLDLVVLVLLLLLLLLLMACGCIGGLVGGTNGELGGKVRTGSAIFSSSSSMSGVTGAAVVVGRVVGST
jgi:hypothetical protein